MCTNVVVFFPSSKTSINTDMFNKSKCQYFEFDKLRRSGGYNSELGKGQRLIDYLEEISCLLGNDYISRLHGNGLATVLSGVRGGNSLIDSLIEHVQEGKPLSDWMRGHETANGKSKLSPGDWTYKFIRTCNLLRHYPVFMKKQDGTVCLVPLNPLPLDVPLDQWGGIHRP